MYTHTYVYVLVAYITYICFSATWLLEWVRFGKRVMSREAGSSFVFAISCSSHVVPCV